MESQSEMEGEAEKEALLEAVEGSAKEAQHNVCEETEGRRSQGKRRDVGKEEAGRGKGR